MKYLFSISRYKDYRQNIFDEIISPRNQEYCNIHNYKYVVIGNDVDLPPFRNHPSWYKMYVINDLLNHNKLNDDDTITWIDADAFFVRYDKPFESEKSLTYSIDSGNSHCFGAGSLKINDWSRQLIKNIIEESRYNKLISKTTKHEHFGTYSSFLREFYEQAAFYYLAGIKRHSDISFFDIENYGWNSEITEDTVYSVEELQENVCILPTEYNCTIWEGESDTTFNINKVKKEDVVIRHMAGAQDWNNYKNWI